MKKQYIKPSAECLKFAGLQLLTDLQVSRDDYNGDPNTAKRNDFTVWDDEEEEHANEVVQSYSLPRFSVWD